MMHSKKDMIFSKCPHNVECAKNRENEDEVLEVLDVVCVDDNGDPHVNNGRGKKIGDIFPAQVESNPGGTAVG